MELENYSGPERRHTDRPIHRKRWIALVFWIIVFSSAVIAGTVVYQVSNRHRINDIQKSRRESCERTYAAIREVFQPFLPKESQMTNEQRQRIREFNHNINVYISHCAVQTNTGGN